jgi:hypothetical protein
VATCSTKESESFGRSVTVVEVTVRRKIQKSRGFFPPNTYDVLIYCRFAQLWLTWADWPLTMDPRIVLLSS